MSIQSRGGIPRYIPTTAVDTGGKTFAFRQLTIWVRIKVSANCTLFSSLADMTADKNGFPLVAASDFEAPLEDEAVFIKAATTANVNIAYMCRKA